MNPFGNKYSIVCQDCGALLGDEPHFCPNRKNRGARREIQRESMTRKLKELRKKIFLKKSKF